MENPFEVILEKFNRIEQQLKELKVTTIQEIAPPPPKVWMNVKEAAEYLSASISYVYKLTASMDIPHIKQGKLLYFKRDQIDEWLLKSRVKTRAEIEQEAINKMIDFRKKRH